MVRRLNIDGDGQGDLGGHGGEQRAVLVYQLDSYRHWQTELGRDDLVHGQFGENLTVDGLPDDEVCIGDRYRIGDAVFEVTQPRVTCYRVGIRLGEPRMAALLVAHGRPGFYMRVLTEGLVEAGDEIVKLTSGPGADDRRRGGRAAVRVVASPRSAGARPHQPGAEPGLAGVVPGRARGADSGATASGNVGSHRCGAIPPPAWTGFRPLVVTAIEAESRTVTSFRLGSVDGSPVPAALPGQFLTLRLHPAASDAALIRTYSLSGPPGAADYRISVKREPLGAGSRYLHDELRVGQTIEVAAPRGTFTLRHDDNPIVLASAGVGATPMLAMLHALATQRSPRPVWWLHSARNRAEHAFADEARALLAELPHARAEMFYSAPDDADRLDDDTVRGRLSEDAFRALALPADAEVYLCGPAGFMTQLTAALVELGIDPQRIHSEPFGAHEAITPGVVGQSIAAPHAPPGPPGDWTVGVVRSQQDHRQLGRGATPACWSSPKRAACPSSGRVAPGCATPARRRCCPGRWRTRPSPSVRRARATC